MTNVNCEAIVSMVDQIFVTSRVSTVPCMLRYDGCGEGKLAAGVGTKSHSVYGCEITARLLQLLAVRSPRVRNSPGYI